MNPRRPSFVRTGEYATWDPASVVLQFVERINEHDVEGLIRLITPEHRFIDAQGNVIQGRENIRGAWQFFFEAVPGYWLKVEDFSREGDTVAVIGTAQGIRPGEGTPEERCWRTPVAVWARVENEKVSEWRVFADLEPLRQPGQVS